MLQKLWRVLTYLWAASKSSDLDEIDNITSNHTKTFSMIPRVTSHKLAVYGSVVLEELRRD
jgi:hypothetical protein